MEIPRVSTPPQSPKDETKTKKNACQLCRQYVTSGPLRPEHNFHIRFIKNGDSFVGFSRYPSNYEFGFLATRKLMDFATVGHKLKVKHLQIEQNFKDIDLFIDLGSVKQLELTYTSYRFVEYKSLFESLEDLFVVASPQCPPLYVSSFTKLKQLVVAFPDHPFDFAMVIEVAASIKSLVYLEVTDEVGRTNWPRVGRKPHDIAAKVFTVLSKAFECADGFDSLRWLVIGDQVGHVVRVDGKWVSTTLECTSKPHKQ